MFDNPKPHEELMRVCQKCGQKDKMQVSDFVDLDENGKRYCDDCAASSRETR